MWESCLSGSERGWGTTMIRKRYCGTAAKAGGNRENEHRPKLLESPSYSKVTLQWLPIEEEPGMAGQASLGKV